MNLKTYVEAGHGVAARLARDIKVQASLVSFWADGRRPVPVERCVQIEYATGGQVMRWDTRPLDWHRIWPELRTRVDAPPLPGAQRAAKLPAQAQAAPAAAAAALEG